MALEDFLWRGFGLRDDESVLPQDLRDQVTALDLNQKQELLKSLKLLIAREFLRDPVDGGMPACPHCGCTRVVRKGKNGDGSQRWLCKLCDRTFCASTSSVLALSKLPEETWLTYAEGMAEGKTLRQLAEMCEVSLKTSWYMRMRLCEAMGAHLPEFRSGPGVNVEVDGTMRRESFKGNNSKGGFVMPRDRHESGKSLHVRGVSGHQCCILCAVNDLGDVYAHLMGRAHGTIVKIRFALDPILERGTHVATDDLASYDSVLEELGCEHEVRPSKPKAGEKGLGMVNAVHLRLEQFLQPFHGVSTRRLNRYLSWFCWIQAHRSSCANGGEPCTREAMTGTYESRISFIFNEPRWDMHWWSTRLAKQSTATA